jgi:hypothetical protein
VVSATGGSAKLIDQTGTITPLTPENGVYTLQMEPATNQNSSSTPWSAYSIGGPPLILIETDTQPPEVTMDPLGVIAPPNIHLSWSGEDWGSGIRSDYDVWVYEDGITMTNWLQHTEEESAIYLGEPGKTYGFSVIGRDRAGNKGSPPAIPEVVTTVGLFQLYLPLAVRRE